MGNLKTEGDAVNVTAPAATEILFGELYRIDGWTGFAMSHILATDTDRNFALEVANRIWYVKLPSGLAAARGAVLYWTTGTGFKNGQTDLSATVSGSPVAKVEEAVDANLIAGIRTLNIS